MTSLRFSMFGVGAVGSTSLWASSTSTAAFGFAIIFLMASRIWTLLFHSNSSTSILAIYLLPGDVPAFGMWLRVSSELVICDGRWLLRPPMSDLSMSTRTIWSSLLGRDFDGF